MYNFVCGEGAAPYLDIDSHHNIIIGKNAGANIFYATNCIIIGDNVRGEGVMHNVCIIEPITEPYGDILSYLSMFTYDERIAKWLEVA
jgi:hypothetical protein